MELLLVEKGEDSLRSLETHSGLSTLLLMPLQQREESDECNAKCWVFSFLMCCWWQQAPQILNEELHAAAAGTLHY